MYLDVFIYWTILSIVAENVLLVNLANPGDHVPEGERNNRTSKERMRVSFHRLPFKAMPWVMVRYQAMSVTSQCNYFPAKGGVSEFYSPRTILGGSALDYERRNPLPESAGN